MKDEHRFTVKVRTVNLFNSNIKFCNVQRPTHAWWQSWKLSLLAEVMSQQGIKSPCPPLPPPHFHRWQPLCFGLIER